MSAAHARHRRSGGLSVRWRRTLIVVGIGVVVVVALVLVVVVLPSRQAPGTGASKSADVPASASSVKATVDRSSTTTSLPVNSAVAVNVLNASNTNGLAAQTAAALTHDGFTVNGIGNAPSQITPGGPSEIYYGSGGLPAAHTLAHALSGPVTFATNAALNGNSVILWIADTQPTVTTTTTTSTTTTTTTSATTQG